LIGVAGHDYLFIFLEDWSGTSANIGSHIVQQCVPENGGETMLSNSSNVYEVATFAKHEKAMFTAVALLTGRVYQDGLGGLRAVLFLFCATS
jgi:hypothetical protein